MGELIDNWTKSECIGHWDRIADRPKQSIVVVHKKKYSWNFGKYDRYTDLISELMANQTGVSDPIQILTKHPIKDVQIGPYNFQSISDPIQKVIELLPAFIEIQGVQFEFSLFLNGPDMRLVYSISSVEEGSSHFEMWSQYGCWENLFFDGTTQGFLWLSEGIGSVLDLLEAVKDCVKFLVENKLNPTQDPDTSREYNRPHPDIKYGQPQTTGAGVLAYFGKFGELPIDTATAGQTLGMDGNWQPKKDEDYFAWDTDFGVQSFVNLNPEIGRIDMEKYGRLFPTKEAAEDYGRTTTTNALLPLMELKMAVDRGETIVDDGGNTAWQTNGYYYQFSTKGGWTKFGGGWEGVAKHIQQTKGWRIKPTTEPEPDNYPLLMAYLGMGKTLRSSDLKSAWADPEKEGVCIGDEDVIEMFAPWSDVVEQILKRHKGWKKI